MASLHQLLALSLSLCTMGCAHGPLDAIERRLLYHPKSAGPYDAAKTLHAEDAWFQAADGAQLHGWYMDAPHRRGVVLYMHGNADNVAYWSLRQKELVNRHQVAVLLFDYRGYGKSEGVPSEQGIALDVAAARAWLARRTGVEEQSVILLGHSLGGAVAVESADQLPPRALVLISTFTSAPDVGGRFVGRWPAKLLMRQRFNSVEKIARYQGPLLVFHGEADNLIPIAQGEALFRAAGTKDKEFLRIPGGGHNDDFTPLFHDKFAALLARLPNEQAPQAVGAAAPGMIAK